MSDGVIFMCGDCGKTGSLLEVRYYEVPGQSYAAEDEGIKKLLAKNGMRYLGCPDCKSPNTYFKESAFGHRQPESRATATAAAGVSPAPVDDEDVAVLLENAQARPERSVSRIAGAVAAKRLAPSAPEDPQELPNIDPSLTGTGKHRPPKPKKLFKKECARCNREFETKHPDIRHCKPCLKGMQG